MDILLAFVLIGIAALAGYNWHQPPTAQDAEQRVTQLPNPRPNTAPQAPAGQLGAQATAAIDTCEIPTGLAHRGGTPNHTELDIESPSAGAEIARLNREMADLMEQASAAGCM